MDDREDGAAPDSDGTMSDTKMTDVDGVASTRPAESTLASTRSSRRATNSRPNYAEDLQDAEFERQTATKTQPALPTTEQSRRASIKASRVVGKRDEESPPISSKDGTPVSSNADAPKKRKATASKVKRASLVSPAPVAGPTPETNMMFFEKTNATLKDGMLVADDGTTLEVNGEFP